VFGEEAEALASSRGQAVLGGAMRGRNMFFAGKAAAAPAAADKLSELQVARPESAPPQRHTESVVVERDEAANAKLDPALRGLEAKLVGGAYTAGNVKVRDGWVEVFIRLSDDSTASLDALKKAGVEIESHARSSKRLLARVRVKDLAAIARFDFVVRIEPPVF